ncbi:alpha/beta fold hydrolase [Candidatus Finniella inopinata]|uniref:Alpha/beta hydrolase n=1 Tax=Candidatus Finniella inopinata TaxID=1696036 RepID=A0A4Q7DL15_9PROT|nr:alpha/beta hydrolase [Candidatus Finniella inopinata]RZI46925.1 alpha/beta hydrolase [Candidatus Finniella inopinata]
MNNIIGHKLYGKGLQKVVVLHDWFGDTTTNYDPMLEFLDRDTFTFAFVDLRGYGRSRNISGECTLEEGVSDILALVDFLKWSSFDIISHSMSALIAQYLTIQASSRLKRIVAITPVPACGTPAPDAVISFLEDAALRNEISARQIIQFMTGYQQGSEFVDKKVTQWYETSNPEARSAYLKMFSQIDFSEQANGGLTPFLVIVGANDAEGYREPVMQQTFIKWYPNAELITLQGCGHYPMQEQPLQLAVAIQSYLKQA